MFQLTRRGVSIVYVAVGLTVLAGMISLAVDYGRVQLAKTELRRAADAAARAGATGLGNYVTAQSLAVQYAALNSVDGSPLALDPATTDIEFGTWDDVKNSFAVVTGTA